MAEESTKAQGALESEVRELHLKEEGSDTEMDNIPEAAGAKAERSVSFMEPGAGTPLGTKRSSLSPVKREGATHSPAPKDEDEEVLGGDVTLKQEPGKPPKLSRSTSHKVEKRAPQLFLDYPDATGDATKSFSVITDCTYVPKDLGTTDVVLDCDCSEEWGK